VANRSKAQREDQSDFAKLVELVLADIDLPQDVRARWEAMRLREIQRERRQQKEDEETIAEALPLIAQRARRGRDKKQQEKAALIWETVEACLKGAAGKKYSLTRARRDAAAMLTAAKGRGYGYCAVRNATKDF
jgi:hypothetical protein